MALALPNVRNLLNIILGTEYYRVGYPQGYAKRFFDVRVSEGKPWIVSVRQSPEKTYGHTLIVCGGKSDRYVKVLDPWGNNPGKDAGTVGIITADDFFRIWANSDCAALYFTSN